MYLYYFSGLLIIILVVASIFFAIYGEIVVEELKIVRQLKHFINVWGSNHFDKKNLTKLQNIWENKPDKGTKLEPELLESFVRLKAGDIVKFDGAEIPDEEKTNEIGLIISGLVYPKNRLSRITHELRAYSGLLASLTLFHILMTLPAQLVATPSDKYIVKTFSAIVFIGKEPIGIIAWVEALILGLFLSRFINEALNLKVYKSRGEIKNA